MKRRKSMLKRLRLDSHPLWTTFLTAAVVVALPPVSQAQESPKTTIFLADQELGVAGAYQYHGNTLYFEARTPERSSEMSVRLLDAWGRTIATSGHSMDDVWLENSAFEAQSASRSLSVATGLPAALANELDAQIFAPEIDALSNLAFGASQRPGATSRIVIDSATSTPTRLLRSAASLQIANDSDAAAAGQLIVNTRTPQTLSMKLGNITVETFREYFPDGENEENPTTPGRTEVSAQIVSSNGKSMIQQIGGEDIPAGWDSETTGLFRPGSKDTIDPIASSVEVGRAIKTGALLTRFPSAATPEETEAVGNLTAILREEGLFPNSAVTPVASASSTCGACYRGSVQVWHKALAGVFQHSGTVVLHYNDNNPSRFPVLEYSTTYCNHGTCPGHKPMVHPCTYNGPWLTYYRYAPHHKITAPPPTPVSGYHSCYKTPYHLNGGFPWPWDHGHNCNDDTWTQVRAIRGEPYAISNGARCDDHALDPRSPGCSE
jgi:hypothetical protein